MAETYENYKTNRAIALREGEHAHPSLETRLDAALNQGELLKGVYARLESFVKAWEDYMEFDVQHIKEIRENPESSDHARLIADNMELEVQILRTAPNQPENARLLLDDLKVLLDQMPEGYRD